MQYPMGFSPTNSISISLMKNTVANKPERNHLEVTPSEESVRGRPLGIIYLDNKKCFDTASYKNQIYERMTTIYSKA